MRRLLPGVLTALSLSLIPGQARAEAPARVWVFFVDHGRSPAQLKAELDARRAELGSRTLARRAKVRADGLVDARDLLPAPAYVDALVRAGAEVRVQSRWLNAVSVEVDGQGLRALEQMPFVRGWQPLARAQARELELQPAPLAADPDDYGVGWEQLELIGVPELHDCGLSGAGVLMGVQDTGFSLTHQAYTSTEVVAERDFIDEDDNVGPEMGDPPNQHIHGTIVLATITGDDPGTFVGAAPGVSVLLSKTEATAFEEPVEEDYYVEGLEWVESMGADIFTGSLGYSDWYSPEDFDGASAVTTVAVEAAVQNGLIVFTSMGNAGPEPSTIIAPADAPGAISLGATNVMGQLANFSSRGPTADDRIKPDVVAPGWDIVTVNPGSPDEYVQVNGTSFSTPIAAGVGALLLEAYPWLTPADMAELLRSTASQAEMPDNDYGYGIIDAFAAAELYCTCVDSDGDMFFDEACGGTDCEDGEAGSYPGAEELCDGLDNDCDGELLPEELDADQDGFATCAGDCDDQDPEANPEAAEQCDNQVDDDCDGLVDGEDPDCAPGGDGDGEDEDDEEDGPGEGSEDDSGEAEDDSGEESDTGTAAAELGGTGCACTAGHGDRGAPVPLSVILACLGLVGLRRR